MKNISIIFGTRDRAAVAAAAITQIVDASSVPEPERWDAIANYLRQEFADIERLIAADRGLGDA
jgi:hypothetical protein